MIHFIRTYGNLGTLLTGSSSLIALLFLSTMDELWFFYLCAFGLGGLRWQLLESSAASGTKRLPGAESRENIAAFMVSSLWFSATLLLPLYFLVSPTSGAICLAIYVGSTVAHGQFQHWRSTGSRTQIGGYGLVRLSRMDAVVRRALVLAVIFMTPWMITLALASMVPHLILVVLPIVIPLCQPLYFAMICVPQTSTAVMWRGRQALRSQILRSTGIACLGVLALSFLQLFAARNTEVGAIVWNSLGGYGKYLAIALLVAATGIFAFLGSIPRRWGAIAAPLLVFVVPSLALAITKALGYAPGTTSARTALLEVVTALTVLCTFAASLTLWRYSRKSSDVIFRYAAVTA